MVARIQLAHLPTPLEPAPRLAAALHMDDDALWIKRDDCTGLGGGGNKARKLEYLCADALAQGCDTLVTGGGRQSNHVRMTAAAANKLGLDCTIVLSSDPPATPTGNVVLDLVLRPTIEWAGRLDYVSLEAAIDDAAERLRAAGKRPYAMPIGGASVIGEQGYVACAAELPDDVDLVVTAIGSGGTQAGLVAGLGDHAKVLGVDVGARTDPAEAVAHGAAAAAEYAGLRTPVGTPQVDFTQVGPGYAVPTAEGREAVDLAARTEALLLDPVYTGKAMAGLVAARRAGRIERHTRTVFLHTGGLPALFAYAEWVRSGPT
ncbi:MAG TPA: D-cysteine desulfhydrase family protein [Acidimicrobiales bacterium]|nr:D-cysteine desulfhydrase family protein [Acidimicrobiales bacterium]